MELNNIREVLESYDIDRLKTLLPTIDKNELKTELNRKIPINSDNATQEDAKNRPELETIFTKIMRLNPEFAFKVLFLLTTTDRKEIYPQFTWTMVFDFVDRKNNSTANNERKSRVTANQFLEKIRRLFPEIKPEEIDVFQFKSLHHYRIALLLGAPNDNGALFVENVMHPYRRDNYPRSHKKLLDWLIQHKFLTKNPFGVADFAYQLIHGNKEMINTILHTFPGCIEAIDEYGKNIFHRTSCSSGVFRYKYLPRLLSRLRAFVSPQKLAEMFAQRCHENKIPVLSYLPFALPDYRPLPLEIVLALVELVRTHRHEDLAAAASLADWFGPFYNPSVLWLHLHQCGWSSKLFDYSNDFAPLLKLRERNAKIEPGNRYDLFYKPEEAEKQEKFYTKIVNSIASIFDKNSEPHPDQPCHILNLPQEMQLLIAQQMFPQDMFDFLTCCKDLSTCLKADNTTFWRQYNESKFLPLNYQGSQKKRFLTETRGLLNWQANKSHEIVLPGPQVPRLMDENWILFMEANKRIQYWSCHSQRFEHEFAVAQTHYEPVALMTNYGQNEIPNAIAAQGYWGNKKFYLMREGTIHELPKLTETYNGFPGGMFDSVVPIDHRVLYSLRMTLYDVATDTVLHQIPEANLNPRSLLYNAHNGTIVTARLNQLFVHDLDYKLVQSFDIEPTHHAVDLQLVDEFTVLVHRKGNSRSDADTVYLYDLRTQKRLSELRGFSSNGDIIQYSPQRLLIRSHKVPLVTAWHVPSQQIEWSAVTEQYPRLLNARYWLSFYEGHTHVHDYCSNKIGYKH